MSVILNTRPADQAGPLTAALRDAGFAVAEIPLVEIRPLPDLGARLAALDPETFTGLFLSSPNGLRHFAAALAGLPDHRRAAWAALPAHRVGPAVDPLLAELGLEPGRVPRGRNLGAFLAEYPASYGERWLHPCSAKTRLDPEAFRAKGVEVVNLPAYAPALPPASPAAITVIWDTVAAAVFCSGSAVGHFAAALPGPLGDLRAGRKAAISIGPSTSDALRNTGVTRFREAARADDTGLAEAALAVLAPG